MIRRNFLARIAAALAISSLAFAKRANAKTDGGAYTEHRIDAATGGVPATPENDKTQCTFTYNGVLIKVLKGSRTWQVPVSKSPPDFKPRWLRTYSVEGIVALKGGLANRSRLEARLMAKNRPHKVHNLAANDRVVPQSVKVSWISDTDSFLVRFQAEIIESDHA